MDSGQGSAQTKQAKKSKKWPKVLLAVVLVASLAGNAFLVYQVATTQSPKVGSVCGEADIAKINKIISYDESEYTEEKMRAFVKDITSRKEHKSDPNCINMLFLIVAGTEIISSAEQKALYESYEQLSNKGLSPSLNIDQILSKKTIKTIVSGS